VVAAKRAAFLGSLRGFKLGSVKVASPRPAHQRVPRQTTPGQAASR
jgi:hypothetical protein